MKRRGHYTVFGMLLAGMTMALLPFMLLGCSAAEVTPGILYIDALSVSSNSSITTRDGTTFGGGGGGGPETDPIWGASPSFGITAGNIASWNTVTGKLASANVTETSTAWLVPSANATGQIALTWLGSGVPDATKVLMGNGLWTVLVSGGDMTKAVYDPNLDGVIAVAQLDPTLVVTSDPRLSDNRTPSLHGNEAHTSVFALLTDIANDLNLSAAAQWVISNFTAGWKATVDNYMTSTINGYAVSGNVTLTANDVGLGNVNNTSDLNKPISTATQIALDGKAAINRPIDAFGAASDNTGLNASITAHGLLPKLPNNAAQFLNGVGAWAAPTASAWGSITGTLSAQTDLWNKLLTKVDTTTTVNGYALSANVTLAKGDVGLGNVTNDAQAKASEKGAASGVATLNTATKVVENPASANVTAGAARIPIAGGGGTLDSAWIPDLSGTYQATSGKDATGGYAGLTLFKINFKNALNTVTSFFTNSNTVARTYTFQDRDGTIADDTDLGGKISHSLATAANDFLVASGAGTFVKKTLAETLTILGKAAANGLASLDGSSLVIQNPANATATPGASKIPISGAGSTLATGWIPDHSGTYLATDTDLTALAGLVGVEGDIIYRSATQWQRLPKGTSLQLLRQNAGLTAPEWATIAGGGDVVGDDVSTTVQNIVAYNAVGGKNITELTGTQGDVLYYNGTGWVKLPKGIAAQVLTMNAGATAPTWAASAGGATDPEIYKKLEMQIIKNQALATVSLVGIITPTLTATASSADDLDGRWLNHATSTVSGNPSGVISALFTIFRRDWEVEYITTIKTDPTTLTSSRYWIGVFSGSPDAIARGTGTIHLAAFSYDTGLADTAFWRAVTSGGVVNTFTTTVTSQPIVANTKYLMRIIMSNTTNDIKFYINDVLVATHNTNMPTSTQLLGYGNRITTLTTLARNIKWGRIAIRTN